MVCKDLHYCFALLPTFKRFVLIFLATETPVQCMISFIHSHYDVTRLLYFTEVIRTNCIRFRIDPHFRKLNEWKYPNEVRKASQQGHSEHKSNSSSSNHSVLQIETCKQRKHDQFTYSSNEFWGVFILCMNALLGVLNVCILICHAHSNPNQRVVCFYYYLYERQFQVSHS